MSNAPGFQRAGVPPDPRHATGAVLALPGPIAAALSATGARPVEGESAEPPVNLAPKRAPGISGTVLRADRSLPDRIGIAAGEQVGVRLRPAPDGRVETPADLAPAPLARDVATAREAPSPRKRRGLPCRIDTAGRPRTRARRITAMSTGLANGAEDAGA